MKRSAEEVALPVTEGGSKRARMTLEESRDLVSAESMPSTMERMEISSRFFSVTSSRHLHSNEARADITLPTPIYLFTDTLRGPHPDWVEQTLVASGDLGKEVVQREIYKALGVQQYQRFSDAIATGAVVKTVFDPRQDLKCTYCGIQATDEMPHSSAKTAMLFTIATERNTRCRHPRFVDHPATWAVDPVTKRHPFESSPIYGPDGRTVVGREGTAICHLCLWTRQIAQDVDLMDSLQTWSDFTQLVQQDWLYPKDTHTRRICSCLYHSPAPVDGCPRHLGTMCLFRFSRVRQTVHPNGLAGVDSSVPMSNWDVVASKRAEDKAIERGYYTLDDPDFQAFTDTISNSYATRVLQSPEPFAPAPAPLVQLPPLPAADLNFDDPAACFAFMKNSKPVMDNFLKAMQTVTRYYGASIQIARPHKSTGRLDCRSCGHTGHVGQKKCPFVLGKIQERQPRPGKGQPKAQLTDHILENIENFGSDQRDSLLAIQGEHQWEIDEIILRVDELIRRYQQGISTAVIPGPDPQFIGHNPSADQRRRSEAPRCTPLVPLKTLASCTLDMIMRGVNMELFLDERFLVNMVLKMHLKDLDTTDVRHLIDWCRALTPAERQDPALAAIKLHEFVKRVSTAQPPMVPHFAVQSFFPPTQTAPTSAQLLQLSASPVTAVDEEEDEKERVDDGAAAFETDPLNLSF